MYLNDIIQIYCRPRKYSLKCNFLSTFDVGNINQSRHTNSAARTSRTSRPNTRFIKLLKREWILSQHNLQNFRASDSNIPKIATKERFALLRRTS